MSGSSSFYVYRFLFDCVSLIEDCQEGMIKEHKLLHSKCYYEKNNTACREI